MAAGKGAYFADQGGPVIVDRGAELTPELIRPRRPIPQSQGTGAAPRFEQLANISVEVASSDTCGTRSPQRLVACLDTDGRFAAADELALLARLPQATSIEAGSVQAREAVIAASTRADLHPAVEPIITAFAGCTGACAGRVVVESAP